MFCTAPAVMRSRGADRRLMCPSVPATSYVTNVARCSGAVLMTRGVQRQATRRRTTGAEHGHIARTGHCLKAFSTFFDWPRNVRRVLSAMRFDAAPAN